jgi:hypothetical protein
MELELDKNMQFEIKSGFMPNLSMSDSLTILEVTQNSVVIQMNKSNGRGVFPSENLQYWIKKGLLVKMDDQHKKTS